MSLPLLTPRRTSLLGGVSVVAVGVGLAAMVFALVDAYVWRPLPYADPSRLVAIDFARQLPTPGRDDAATQADIPSLESWRARRDLFDDVAAFEDRDWLRVQLSGRILPVRAVAASGNFFRLLGLDAEWTASDRASTLVSRRLATTLSAGELAPGRSAALVPDGAVHVDGLLPRPFVLPEAGRVNPPDALVILPEGPVMTKAGKSTSWPHMIARLRAGVTPDVASAALTATMPGGQHVEVTALQAALTAHVRSVAIGGLMAGALIVVVCWMNVFSLALTRGLYRAPELATRAALGATPGRLIRLLVKDALSVAALGGAGALIVASLTLAAVVRILPSQFLTLGIPTLTGRVVAAVALAAATAGLSWSLASLAAWRFGVARRHRLVAGQDGRAIRLVRFSVVAGQLGAATVLLAGAILLGRPYLNILGVEVGMDDQSETLTVAHDSRLALPLFRETVDQTVDALRRAPGVRAVGVSISGFLDGRSARQMISELHVPRDQAMLDATTVSGDYFNAIGLTFVAGHAPDVDEIVVNETLARLLDGERSPVGRTVSLVGRTAIVAGVVRDVRSRGITVEPRPALFQRSSDSWSRGPVTYVVRFDERSSRARWMEIVQQVDRMAVVLDSGSVGSRLGRTVRDKTFATLVVGLFALATIVVTAVGLTGIVAYTVVRRAREIAIRLAIGAPRRRVMTLVIRDALSAGACGIIGGIVVSVWISDSLENLLFGITPTDLGTLVLTGACLVAVVLCAAGLPAVRAAGISPATALRID